jgi:uncharacterized protein
MENVFDLAQALWSRRRFLRAVRPEFCYASHPMFSLQRLLGKEDKFFDLLEASAEAARSSARALSKLVRQSSQVKSLDELSVSRRQQKQINLEITEALCTTFVTALDREDIEALSNALYKVPKTVEKIGERILLAPHYLQGVDLARQVSMLEKATDTLLLMLKELRGSVNLNRIRAHNEQLQVVEVEEDKLALELWRNLYVGTHEPTQIVFLKDLFELLEKVTDRCRDAGNVISYIALKIS